MYTRIAGCMITVALLFANFSSAGQKQWPHFRGPNYDGDSVTAPFSATSVKKAWEAHRSGCTGGRDSKR